ncbi:helix-turn-helix transcriptional regulator [Virgisporangium aurantiacum]|uniref:Transcriptional regulator n=1 Tax=Virgisporangium aurantiacum TaxID=175570 RepID=A0A8J3Z345_9ACTN|nr:LuxR family transcriptional regulator [Virgisporangium aurantiacum]GIJ54411.1 transcriptional regulator [Virgisporangium aurantiacum]
MTSGAPAPELRGRRTARAILDRMVADVRAGQGRALLIRGEAGVGKSALLDDLAGRAGGFKIARVAGVEAEMELAFAGLHQVCGSMLPLRDRLPGPQREALAVAFGYSAGSPPDRFLVGVAVLSLLAVVSEDRPLLCVIDDAQWLDQTSALALTFVARRLLAERIGVVFAVREPADGPQWRGLPALRLGGLTDDDARALLDSVVPGRLDEQVRDRLVAETRGNPLALLELPRGLTAAELAGGFGSPDVRPLASQIERTFAQRAGSLPPPTRKVLLTAAADPVGDVRLLLRAITGLGVPMSAVAPAEAAGLIEVGSRVRFRHPLVRTAIYREASPAERRDVHRALAAATDPAADPDRRAWHRAHAAADADEDVATDLVSSADRAQRRGGLAAAAEFLRRATELTPDPATRATRALAAADAELRSGAFEIALKLLVVADEGPADELHRARVNLMRAQIAFASGADPAASRLLLGAAKRLEPLDVDLARDAYRDAMGAARLATGSGLAEVARAVLAAPKPVRYRPGDLLLDSLAVVQTDGYPAGVPAMRAAVRAFRAEETSTKGDQPWLWLAAITAARLWDDENWSTLTARHVRVARGVGDLSSLPLTLNSQVVVHLFAGERAAAAALVAEIQAIGDATGAALAPYGAVASAAWHGDEAVAVPLIEASLADAVARGESAGVTVAHWARSVLMNGLARYRDAVPAARAAVGYPVESGLVYWSMSELVESAARSGRTDLAADTHERLAAIAGASGTDWALGVLARAGALLVTGAAADSLYRQAIEHLGRTRIRMELARAHLVYGEWLRRENRRQEARGQLRNAHDMFTAAGADAFASRARRELMATGESVAQRATRASDTLTVQEAHIAGLAGDGLTNAEIGAQLFLSPHTVEWHLRKVFTKLSISSRRQLRRS